jgi:hypothetical protein
MFSIQVDLTGQGRAGCRNHPSRVRRPCVGLVHIPQCRKLAARWPRSHPIVPLITWSTLLHPFWSVTLVNTIEWFDYIVQCDSKKKKKIYIYIYTCICVWCLYMFRSINDHLQKTNNNTWENYYYIRHSTSSSKLSEVLRIKILKYAKMWWVKIFIKFVIFKILNC